jgi:hypothetical protein
MEEGFSGQFEIYKKRDIIWFYSINKTISIKSKRGYFGPKSGNYLYEIRQNIQYKVLFLIDLIKEIMYLNGDELIFSNGLIATFKR